VSVVKAKTSTESGLLRVGARERVLEAARILIEAQGYRSASLNDILAKAGVSSSNFYYHWKSKEDLGLAVVRQFTEGLEEHIIKPILQDRKKSPFERLRAYLDLHRQKLEANHCTGGCPFGKLISELSAENACFRELIESAFTRLKDSLRECIREGIERGELRRGIDPGNASTLVLGTVQGLMLLAKGDKATAAFQQGAQELLRLLSDCRTD
jgi:TetR/AcrR family transcriptional regulator, transcriptional repressor for nem operon